MKKTTKKKNEKSTLPHDETIQYFTLYEQIKKSLAYPNDGSGESVRMLLWPDDKIEDINRTMKDLERGGWLTREARARINERLVYYIHTSDNAVMFTLQDSLRKGKGMKKDFAMDFLIYSLVKYYKRTTNKPSYAKIAELLRNKKFGEFSDNEIKKKYDRVRWPEVVRLLSRMGLVNADLPHAEKHLARIRDINQKKADKQKVTK